jgi:hypothetical protein
MSEKRSAGKSMKSILRIHPRYMRSVHLETDFSDPTSSLGYILTPVAQDAFSRISAGFGLESTQRAFRLAGDYGSGKSAFGLALARVAAGKTQELPKPLRTFRQAAELFPLLATGDHEPLGVTVLRALNIRLPKNARPTTSEVLSKIEHAKTKARAKRYKGVLLVLDELGKNLEFAAQNPESDDIFLLQRLAEEADRSSGVPFVIVVMLHQGIAAYSAGINSGARREWDKVAGRYIEIVYAQPIEQVATLVAATLNVDVEALPRSVAEDAKKAMSRSIAAGIYGSSPASNVARLGPELFPLHPTVLPVLVRAIRKFGQNERSLFSFISAAEPYGLQEHIQSKEIQSESYRIHNLFDYVRHNLTPSINAGNSYIHWGFVDSVLSSTELQNVEEEKVLKCVAILNLLDSPDLPATQEFVTLALDSGSSNSPVTKAILSLMKRRALFERGTARGLCLWPNTSVNLDEALQKAVAATATANGVEQLCAQLAPEQVVPRGHYFRSGTLRYGEVEFVPASNLSNLFAKQPVLDGKAADLNLRILLPANQAEFRDATQQLHRDRATLTEGLFVAVAQLPVKAIAALADLVAWKWVHAHTPGLASDRFAREEVAQKWTPNFGQ